MFTVGKVWCFLLRTGMDYKKSIRKTYTVADISGILASRAHSIDSFTPSRNGSLIPTNPWNVS